MLLVPTTMVPLRASAVPASSNGMLTSDDRTLSTRSRSEHRDGGGMLARHRERSFAPS